MNKKQVIDSWDGNEGVKFRIVRELEIRFEIFHPAVGKWSRASADTEKWVLMKRLKKEDL